jgi:hypothetical protein
MGILPLEQARGPNGEIAEPHMICPRCGTGFRAKGMTWVGAFRGTDVTDEV